MRLFTAIDLPHEVREHLHERLDVLRTLREDLRWVPPTNLHLTVRFIGECGARETDRQMEHWAGRCAGIRPFEVSLVGAGCFPHDWLAKVLYAGVNCDPAVWARLSGGEQSPHVTVARTRVARDLTGVLQELADYSSATWHAAEVTMYQSFLERGRASRYVPLERFELGSGRGVPQ